FNQEERAPSVGLVLTEADRGRRAALETKWFKPLARTDRTSLDGKDLNKLSEGRRAEVFGEDYEQGEGINPSIRLPGEMLRMIDEVTRIDRLAGPTPPAALRRPKPPRPAASVS